MCRPTDPQVFCHLSAVLTDVGGYLWPWNVVLVAAYAALWSGTRSANVKALRSLQATAAGLFILFGVLSGLWPMVGFNVIIAWTHLSRLLALDKSGAESEPETSTPTLAPEPATTLIPVPMSPTAPPLQVATTTPLTSYPMPILAPRFIEPSGAALVSATEVLAGVDLDDDEGDDGGDANRFDDDHRPITGGVVNWSVPLPTVQARVRRPPARLGERPGLSRARRRSRVGTRAR